MVSRCLHSGCSSEFASASQLDVHVAFKHVPVEEITFTCAKCKAQFHTGTMLLKHKMDTHQYVDDAAVSPSLCHVLAAGQHTLTDGNGVDEDKDKENAAPAKKPRYQCSRCPYGTEHSAWLLQKHVIYEHLVDALGGARHCDAHLHVPMVGESKRRRRQRPAKREEEPAEQLVFPADAYLERAGMADDGAMCEPMADDYGGVGVLEDGAGGHLCQFDPAELDDYGGAPYEHEPAASPPVRAAKRAKASPPQFEKCPLCPYVTARSAHLRNHLTYVHGGGGDAEQQQQPSTSGGAAGTRADERRRYAGRPHQCHVCAFSATTFAYLRRHVRTVHSGRRYPCDVCGVYEAKRADHLKLHRTACLKRHGVRPE